MPPTRKARGQTKSSSRRRGAVIPVVTSQTAAKRTRGPLPAGRTISGHKRARRQVGRTVSGQRLAGADTGMTLSVTCPAAVAEASLTGMINIRILTYHQLPCIPAC
jgi:hypothetical protein